MTTHSPQLDADELLFLAMDAAKHDRHEAAIAFLKRALEQAPNHAQAHYFLAAEHAQIGMYDRAAEEMARAVELDPGLHTAHFQLGLLHLTAGRLESASSAWQPLDQLGEAHPLFLFKAGLEAMVRDEFDACRDYLTRGIAANTLNSDLNADMEQVLLRLPADDPAPPGQGHVLLSGYRSEDAGA